MTSDVYQPSGAETDPAAKATTPEAGADISSQQEPSLAQLQADLASLRTELQQSQDRFLRKAAEFENYRKRMEKEKGETAQLAKSSLLIEFLPVADACDRALESLSSAKEDGETLEHYREGVRLLHKQIHDVFGRIGVVPVTAQGKPFDPHFHEAVAREEDSAHEENTVTHELRRGYLFKGRLLRPAQVKVATRPLPKAQADA